MSDATGTWDQHAGAIITLLGQTSNSEDELRACERFYARIETDADIDLMWAKYDEYVAAMKAEKRAIRAASAGSFAGVSTNRWRAKSRASALRGIEFRLSHVASLTREDTKIKTGQ